MKIPSSGGLVIAGLSGGSGKSVVTVGLIAAFRDKGFTVAPFKKGPDYIDAAWMAKAAGRACYNLDPYLMPAEQIRATFEQQSACAEVALVEGNRGVFDGVNAEGVYSTAELALLLELPVLLVINCAKTTRTVAALALGCQAFAPHLRFAGLILNQIATVRHERIIRQALLQAGAAPVLGVMPRLGKDIFPMRHLGVTPTQEYAAAEEAVAHLAALASAHCDLDGIRAAMRPIQQHDCAPKAAFPAPRLRIGVLRDAAFQFYYEENLDALRRAGAELVLIDALHAPSLPQDLDALYIGGGFPETSAKQLAENQSFRYSLRKRIEAGLPVYAECGGLIFLGRALILGGQNYPLTDVFPIIFAMSERPQAHGYSSFVVEGPNSFYAPGTRIKGHEFRYSVIQHWEGKAEDLVLKMERGTGFMAGRDGLVRYRTLALYTHILASGAAPWGQGFIAAAAAFHEEQRRR